MSEQKKPTTQELLQNMTEGAKTLGDINTGLSKVVELLSIDRARLRERVTDLLRANNAFEERARAAERQVLELRAWQQDQAINWPMEIERRNRELATAEATIQTLHAALDEKQEEINRLNAFAGDKASEVLHPEPGPAGMDLPNE